MTQTASYEIIRVFDVPREDVFAAWTTPERFARWFGPRFMAAPVDRIVLDARPGGRWQVTLTAEEGFEVTFDGAYREVAPPARLVFTTGEPDDPVSVLTIGLADDDGRTAMTFREHGANAGEESRQGWMEFFDRLHEHLTG
ncbi:SRPBCC family protein [Nonomuraea harbinensis]|uniref:SRPBCC domain-containing protein n=1 Tax=Nonomuraea harbinensis TaxID=1286938 RepID=A0ABW1C8A6_9ACTN|nr:SRPBCC domain-containing protein [Nonomuraea harbinensis]